LVFRNSLFSVKNGEENFLTQINLNQVIIGKLYFIGISDKLLIVKNVFTYGITNDLDTTGND
jgi:hypothetical protein